MKPKYKQDPAAWRTNTLLSVLGLLLVSSLLCWRRVLPTGPWLGIVVVLVAVGMTAWIRPQWFRGYYLFSTWAGFWSSQFVAWVMLALLFVFVIAPVGIVLRLLGKDPLKLKRAPGTTSYWQPAPPRGNLDRLF